MSVRLALNSDKDKVLEFCENTFSWGDYISDVWKYWISEGNLLTISVDNTPVAICHASVSKTSNQVWIEGIRVHEDFRKRKFATNLIKESESIAQKNKCNLLRMLIESNNTKSINLAQKLDYKHEETWKFYTLFPKLIDSKINIEFANHEKNTPDVLFSSKFSYVKSWRWFPLTPNLISTLSNEQRIIFSKNKDVDGLAVFTDSEHFEKTLLVTILYGNKNGIKNILQYIQNYAFKNDHKRIQILTKIESIPEYIDLEHRLIFYLMEKKL